MPRNWSEVTEDTGIGNPKSLLLKKGKVSEEVVSLLRFAHRTERF